MDLLTLIAAVVGLVTALINLFIALRNSADKKKKDSKRSQRLKSRKKKK